MLTIKVDSNGHAIGIIDTAVHGEESINRNNIKDFVHAEQLASQLTAVTGTVYIPVDRGNYCSPRFDVSRCPAVGDEVSRGFNGDYYPCGTIIKVSKTFKRITTSAGHSFYRRGKDACWKSDGMWSLVAGHHTDKNPEC